MFEKRCLFLFSTIADNRSRDFVASNGVKLPKRINGIKDGILIYGESNFNSGKC